MHFSLVRWLVRPLLLAVSIAAAASFPSGHPYRITTPIKHHHVRLFASKKQRGGESAPNNNDIVAIVHSHHLLDHKPDNMILKGGKHKLRGVACLGRPGVALCIGPQAAIDKFRSKLKSAMPQKKFGMTAIDSSSIPPGELAKLNDFDEVTLGELRSLLAALGHEDHFFTLTGIDPSNASSSDNSSGEESNGNSKKSTKKRKKRG